MKKTTKIRKGMVLKSEINIKGDAVRILEVKFKGRNRDDALQLGKGAAVVIYVASVRASAKVLEVMTLASSQHPTRPVADMDSFGFGLEDEDSHSDIGEGEGVGEDGDKEDAVTVRFRFIASKEFVEMGMKVLVLPGGGPGLYGGNERGQKGLAGLESLVGKVVGMD